MSGTPTPSSSRARSRRRYSIVLAANASSWTASPALDHCGSDDVMVKEDPFGSHDVTDVQGVAIEACRLPVLQSEHDVVAHIVEQRHPGVHEDLRPHVGVAPGDRTRGVDHGHRLAGKQGLSADPVAVSYTHLTL